MNKLKISVIIPCYNNEETIKDAIKSFKNQTLPPKEIIVVDDCSTDNSLNIIKKQKVIVLNNAKNMGPSASRNKGAEKATGDFLVFAEGDGKYSANYLEKIIAPLKNKNVGGVLSGKRILWTNKKTLFTRYQNLKWEVVENLMNQGKREIIGAWAFRKEVFKEVGGYNEKYRLGEDVELVDRIKKKKYKILWVSGTFFLHKDPDTFFGFIRDKKQRKKMGQVPNNLSSFSLKSKLRLYFGTLTYPLKKLDFILFYYSLLFPFVSRLFELIIF